MLKSGKNKYRAICMNTRAGFSVSDKVRWL